MNTLQDVESFISHYIAAVRWCSHVPSKNHPVRFKCFDDRIEAFDLGVEIQMVKLPSIASRNRTGFVLVRQFEFQQGNPESAPPVIEESLPMNAKQVARAFLLECFQRILQKQDFAMAN